MAHASAWHHSNRVGLAVMYIDMNLNAMIKPSSSKRKQTG
jgi:hypothetical protein